VRPLSRSIPLMVLPSLTGPWALMPIVPEVRSGRPMLVYEQGPAPTRSLPVAVGAVTPTRTRRRPGDGPATGRRACAVLAVIRAQSLGGEARSGKLAATMDLIFIPGTAWQTIAGPIQWDSEVLVVL
jgi:hypothetical protein